MSGQKRPSFKLPDETIARARALRLEDPRRWTVRALAAELGCGKSAIAEAIREDPELEAARPGVLADANEDLREQLHETAERFLVSLKGCAEAIDEGVAIVRAGAATGENLKALASTVSAASGALQKAIKLARLVSGDSTENLAVRGKVQMTPAPLTAAEERALAALPPEPAPPRPEEWHEETPPAGPAPEGGPS